jgi:hypothetical protein
MVKSRSSKILLLLLLITGNVFAEDSILIVPAQYWNDNIWRSTVYKYFPDTLYVPYEGHVQCMIASKALHANVKKPAPSYSMCANPKAIDKGMWK